MMMMSRDGYNYVSTPFAVAMHLPSPRKAIKMPIVESKPLTYVSSCSNVVHECIKL